MTLTEVSQMFENTVFASHLWLAIATFFGQEEMLISWTTMVESSKSRAWGMKSKAVGIRSRLAPRDVPRSYFPAGVRERAGVVFLKAAGRKPRGKSDITSFLQTVHPLWDELYPEWGKELLSALQRFNPPLEDENELRLSLRSLFVAEKAAEAAHEAAIAGLAEFKLGLLSRLWREEVTVSQRELLLSPIYSGEEEMFRLSSPRLFVEPRLRDEVLHLERAAKPSPGSPRFLEGLYSQTGSKALLGYNVEGGDTLKISALDVEAGKTLNLGEEGRGRRLQAIPVSGEGGGYRIGYAGILPALRREAVQEVNSVLLALKVRGGCRGWVKYTLPEKAVTLAAGHVAQGTAGYAGGWDEMLVVVPTDCEIMIESGGGGGHKGLPRWILVGKEGEVSWETLTQRQTRLAAEASEAGTVKWA